MALQLGRVVLKYSTYKYHTIMAKTQVLAQGIREAVIYVLAEFVR